MGLVAPKGFSITIASSRTRMKIYPVLHLLSFIALSKAQTSCPGFRQNVMIPTDYDKNVPDALVTGNITKVIIFFYVRQIKGVKEDR